MTAPFSFDWGWGVGGGGDFGKREEGVFFCKKKRENGKQNDMQDECLEGLQ